VRVVADDLAPAMQDAAVAGVRRHAAREGLDDLVAARADGAEVHHRLAPLSLMPKSAALRTSERMSAERSTAFAGRQA
jgi:hypothetical protein